MKFNILELKNSRLNKDSFTVFIFKIIGVISGFITNLIIARFYGIDILGMVSLINTFILISTLFVLFGTNTSILKLIPEYSIKYNVFASYNVYKQTMIMIMLISIIVSILLFFISPVLAVKTFHNNELSFYFILSSLFIFFISLKEYNLSVLRALGDIKKFSILSILPQILILVFLAFSTMCFFYKENPIYINIFVPVLVSVVIFFVVKRNFLEKLIFEDIKKTKILVSKREIFLQSFPMFLISGLHLIMSNIDAIMIGMYLDEKSVGLYSIPVKLAFLTSFVLSSINTIVAPKFSEYYHKNDMYNLKLIVKNSSKLIFFTTIPLLIFLIIFGKMILCIYGNEFLTVYNVLLILILGQFINSLSGSVGYFLNMTGHQNKFMFILLFSLILNVSLNISLIHYGLIGVAFATMLSLVSWNIISLFYMKYKFGFTTLIFKEFK